MAYTRIKKDTPAAAALRKQAGAYLKKQREKAEITQNELARILGFDYYTMISQVESGKSRLPPDKMVAWATAIKTDPKEMAKTLLRSYDPFTWQVLFGGK